MSFIFLKKPMDLMPPAVKMHKFTAPAAPSQGKYRNALDTFEKVNINLNDFSLLKTKRRPKFDRHLGLFSGTKDVWLCSLNQ
jgi:hypothetical protein